MMMLADFMKKLTFRRANYWAECFFIYMMSGLLAVQPAVSHAQTAPDLTVPATAPEMDVAPNGVPVVNIVQPTAAGVSHNKFTDYNVEEQGLILNNSASHGVSQLGGGDLLGLDVDGSGAINIEGLGLNAEDVAALDILARTIRVNAQDLKVFAGRNMMDYGARTVTAKTDDGSSKPALAIDGTLFGAMYANRIEVLATEDGVGVKMPKTMAAGNGDLTITADGRIEVLEASASDATTIESVSGDVALTDGVNGGDSLTVTASNGTVSTDAGDVIGALNTADVSADTVDNQGQLIAGLDADGNSTATGTLTVQVTQTLSNSGTLSSGDDIVLTAGQIGSSGTVQALDQNTITADTNVTVTDVVSGTSTAIISTTGDVQINGTVNGGGSLNVSAANGTVTTDNVATVGALNTVDISGQNVSNGGEVAAGMDSDGNGTKNGALTVTAAQTVTNTGILSSGDRLTVQADRIDNDEGSILSIGNMVLEGDGGTKASDIINQSGDIETATGNITIRAENFENRRKVLTTSRTKVFDKTYHETSGNPPRNPPGDGISPEGWAYLPDGSTVVVPHPDRGMDYASYYDFGPIRVRQYEVTVDETSPAAALSSGGNLTIDGGTILNRYSSLAAAGDIVMTGTSLTNEQLNLTKDLYHKGSGHINRCIGGECTWFYHSGSNKLVERKVYDSVKATIQAGGSITGDFTGQIDNDTIVETVDEADLYDWPAPIKWSIC